MRHFTPASWIVGFVVIQGRSDLAICQQPMLSMSIAFVIAGCPQFLMTIQSTGGRSNAEGNHEDSLKFAGPNPRGGTLVILLGHIRSSQLHANFSTPVWSSGPKRHKQQLSLVSFYPRRPQTPRIRFTPWKAAE